LDESAIDKKGIAIDAKISSELLLTIFFNKTPLHDGAVIIENDRIAYAGGILSLSQNNLNWKYGTRHRAALGVTEMSGAVVLVVSEESGDISIAEKGKFTKYEDVRKRALQAVKKGKVFIFQWRGGYLTREVLQELLQIMEEEAENAQNLSIFHAQPGFPQPNIFPDPFFRRIAVYPLIGIAVCPHIISRLGIDLHHPGQIGKLRFFDFHKSPSSFDRL
jgi:hypothetical protein